MKADVMRADKLLASSGRQWILPLLTVDALAEEDPAV